jgi:hypothetical protein
MPWRHGCVIIWQAVEKVSGECSTRREAAKKRSLHRVNEHFEPILNAVNVPHEGFSTAC